MAEALTLYHRHNVCREEDREGSGDLTLYSRRDRNLCAPLFHLFSPVSWTDLCLVKGRSGGPRVTGTHCLSAESVSGTCREHGVRCGAFKLGQTYDKSSRAVLELVIPPLACLNYYALAFWALNYS